VNAVTMAPTAANHSDIAFFKLLRSSFRYLRLQDAALVEFRILSRVSNSARLIQVLIVFTGTP
jgi:hypothetical protein